MANYYFNNKGSESFNENQIRNKNFYNNPSMNSNFNNNFSVNYNNNNRNQYSNNMNFINKNVSHNGNINNRNQFQFNQYNNYSNQHSYKKMYGNQQQNNQVDEISIMQSLQYVAEKYPHLVNLNTSNVGMTNQVKLQAYPKFYVIKSFTEEDIHKVSLLNSSR
jgi:hypothetical protein